MPTSIIVDREMLIKALEKEQTETVKQFKKDMEKFRSDEASYPKRLLQALDDMRASVGKGKLPKMKYGRIELPSPPAKPSRNGRACDLERMIHTLKLSTRKEVRIGEKSEYTKFACKL